MNIRIFIVSVAAISLPVAAHAQTEEASTRW
jgi:hypothetical protein